MTWEAMYANGVKTGLTAHGNTGYGGAVRGVKVLTSSSFRRAGKAARLTESTTPSDFGVCWWASLHHCEELKIQVGLLSMLTRRALIIPSATMDSQKPDPEDNDAKGSERRNESAPLPEPRLTVIQAHFHALIRSRVGHLLEKHQLQLPDLSVIKQGPEPKGHFPIPGMYGGFNFWLEGQGDQAKLIVLSFSRIVGGSEQFYSIHSDGWRLIEGEEFRLREKRWLETGSPVLDATGKTDPPPEANVSGFLPRWRSERGSPTPSKAQRYESLRLYGGRNAVYRAMGLLMPVTIESVVVTERMLEAHLRPLKSPLIRWHNVPEVFEPFAVSSVWEEVSIDGNCWNAPQIGWALVVKPGAYEAVLRLAEDEPELSIPALFKLADFVTHRPDLQEIPYEIRESAARSTYIPRGFSPRGRIG